MKKLFLSFLVLSLAVVSCRKGYDTPVQQEKLPIDDAISIQDAELLPTGQDIIFVVTSPDTWKITGIPSWLSVNPSQGKAGATNVTVSAPLNDVRENRQATLCIQRTGCEDVNVTISQPFPYLSISTDTLSFNWENSRYGKEGVDLNQATQTISISSNVEWVFREISTKADANQVDLTHFALDSLGGFGNLDMHFLPTNVNFSKEPYDLKVELVPVVTKADGKQYPISEKAADSYIVKLHQKNLRFLINDSAADGVIRFNELNDENKYLNIDAEVPWTVVQCPDWVKTVSGGKGGSIESVKFLADGANPTTEQRSGVIRLAPRDVPEAYREIKVSQDPYVFSLDRVALGAVAMIGNDDITEKNVSFTTTGTWEIVNIPDWLSVEPSSCTQTANQSGKSNFTIKLRAKSQNLNLKDLLNTNITIRSTQQGNSLSEVFTAGQEKFVFNIESDATLASIPTMNTAKYPVRITSSGPWEIRNKPEWLDISQLTASSKGSYDITVGANAGNPNMDMDRTTSLTVVSLNHQAAGQTLEIPINVLQRKYTFEVSTMISDFMAIPAYKITYPTYAISVKCSSDWEIISLPDWVEIPQKSGDGVNDAMLYLTPTFNTSRTPRQGTIEIKSYYNNAIKTVNVAQEGFVFDNTAKSYLDVKVMNEKSYAVDFDLTDEVDWTLSASSWLNPDKSSGSGSGHIVFTPSPNPELSERAAIAVIKNYLTGETKNISFQQEKYEFDSTPLSFSYKEITSASDNIDILCSGPWTVVEKPSWIGLSAIKGATSATIKMTPECNGSLTSRNGVFTIKSDLNNLTKSITVSQDAYVFNTTPVTQTYTTLEERSDEITVVASGPWKMTGKPEWITASKTSGEGGIGGVAETITITSKENLTETQRSAAIKIVPDHNQSLSKTISVSQDKFIFGVDKSVLAYSTPIDDSSKEFNVSCTSDWTVSSDQGWVSLSRTSGSGDMTVSATPQKNLTADARMANLTVTSTKNSLTRKVVLTQPEFVFKTDRSSLRFPTPLYARNGALTLSVECSDKWTASSDVSWITLSETSATGNKVIEVTQTADNLGKTPLSGKITLTSVLNGWTRDIDVTIPEFVFDVDKTTFEFESANTEYCSAKTVNVSCSSVWTVSTSDAWISLSKTSGFDNDSFTISASQNNLSASSRTATVIVISSVTGETRTITLTQPGFVFSIDKNSHEFTSPIASENSSLAVNVTCSGDWTVNTNDSWITLSKTSGKSNGSFNVSVKDNIAGARTGSITVKSTLTGETKVISISQAAFIFSLNLSGIEYNSPDGNVCPAETINVTCSGAWKTTSPSWIYCTPSYGSKNGSFVVRVGTNTEYSSRSGIITVTASTPSGDTKELTIAISQPAAVPPSEE